ncbi:MULTISPECIES: hypothetical protein [Pseudomonas]|uniref:Uncharacterized protein n=2 Tax=Pseudomonas TaxID=286 RepID=A0A2X2CG31_PSELU|nr:MULTISPECIES: hypothetical protein [Pseudomonas]ENA29751.1 hypothetical protein HMPREF1487_08005 [Pseudomonas sp. HPB0071]MBA1247678.1 hypothetical protein [Pseudomonas zeshuii]MBF8640725.1 hypothetical protein [Pseudomonas zeshuii]MBW5413377.1 hypothetical protein [Pseudomonas sp. MAG002Y]MCG7371531.1 hypothetical protein [Pseudomonas luteola]
MATAPIDNSSTGSVTNSEQTFDAALESSDTGMTDEEFTQQLVDGAVTVAGQMIIMPRANEILNEAMSDE